MSLVTSQNLAQLSIKYMQSTLASQLSISQHLGGVFSPQMKSALLISIPLLMNDHRLQSIQIVALIKGVSLSNYLILDSDSGFFMTQDGSFWSPLPPLSISEAEQLDQAGYGHFSEIKIVGDPSIKLICGLTELHRVSFLCSHWKTQIPRPRGVISPNGKGLHPTDASNIEAFVCSGTDTSPSDREWVLTADMPSQRTTLSSLQWPGLTTFGFWGSRVAGWFYSGDGRRDLHLVSNQFFKLPPPAIPTGTGDEDDGEEDE
eukprot:gnl/Dysnectes_brevis/3575_a4546_1099.p1 GENE.gnl/Dysnectes_brevis/3575_a4546_1099~~gnl/Dysnectes_brevis/3575_a4546_1099.p1  ORF type:complete len:260 (+),score=12.29 gnl/Dysnectes_brevis/3575_a4546_1099:340-1119(+)